MIAIEGNTHNIEPFDSVLRARGYVSLPAGDGLEGIRGAGAQRP